jgi:hypothetical protein
MRLSISAESSGPIRHVKRMLPPALVHLFTFAETNSLDSGTGPWAHESPSLGAGSWVQKSRTVARASTAHPWGHRRRQRRWIFKTNAAVSRHPAHGPAKLSSTKAMGQSAEGTGVTVGVTEGVLALIMTASA